MMVFFWSRIRAHFLTTRTIRHFLHRLCFLYNGEIILLERSISRSWLLLLDAHKMRERERKRVYVDGITLFFFYQSLFISLSLSLQNPSTGLNKKLNLSVTSSHSHTTQQHTSSSIVPDRKRPYNVSVDPARYRRVPDPDDANSGMLITFN